MELDFDESLRRAFNKAAEERGASSIAKALDVHRQRHGHRPVTLYDLRHTFATLMANGDPARGIPPTPLTELRVLMGHSSIEMTARYAHSAPATWAMAAYAARLGYTVPAAKDAAAGPAESVTSKPLKKPRQRVTGVTKAKKH